MLDVPPGRRPGQAMLASGLGLWSAFFAAGLGAVYVGLALDSPAEPTLLVVTFVAGLLLIVLERLRPKRPEWRVADGQWWHDLGHFALGFGAGTFGGAALAEWVLPAPLWAIWPTRWPMLIQIVLGLIAAEFIAYWHHRAMHTFAWFWPMHALHHGTDRMTFFKTTRIHALDLGVSTFLSVASLIVLGADARVMLWVTAFGNFAAQSQHANVRFATPAWLDALVGTPAVHWLHHSADRREGNSNFGMNVMLFDHLFGTYTAAEPARLERLVIGSEPVPSSFLGQLALPREVVRRLRRRM